MNNIYLETASQEGCTAISEPLQTPCEAAGGLEPAEAGTPNRRFQKVNRSPDEEYAARRARVAPLVKFPREVVAAFMFQFKELSVTRNGLTMKIGKERFVYWHEHSKVCAQVGQTFSVGYQLEDLDWIAVFDAAGALVEIVPQKFRAPWFDDEAMQQATRAVAQANNRLKERFEDLHAPTAEARLNRTLSNAERLQIVNTLPAPGDFVPAPATRADAAQEFTRAGALAEAGRGIAQRRGAHVERERQIGRNVRRMGAEAAQEILEAEEPSTINHQPSDAADELLDALT